MFLAVVGLIGLLAFDGVAEWLVVLPVCAALVRVVPLWRSLVDAACRGVSAAVVACGVWGLVTLAWTSDVMNGLDELSAWRHALLVLALWPLRDHRGVLIAALAAGFALGHLTQVGHAIGVWGDVEWLRWPRWADRNSGWWDPVVGGTLLCGAVGLHLPAALWGRGMARWVGVAGVSVALGGVVATGTRGAWIAAAAMVAIALGAAAVRAVRVRGAGRRRATARGVWIGLGVALLVIVAAGLAAGPTVLGRAQRGVDEVRRAVEAGDFQSDTGRRLFMWVESWRAVREHPVGGVGAGGLGDFATRGAEARGVSGDVVLAHAHGMWVHAAATTGVVGVMLWAVVIGAAVVVGVTRVSRLGRVLGAGSTTVGPSAGGRGKGGRVEALREAYSLGPALGLVGVALAGVFDSVQLNSQTAMLMFALVGLCVMGRWRVGANRGGD